eukprot:TRINITY_DN3322_c0_g1_i1.p2 TRINITY_DN3322_c0_g1~~TRINITY_DN3322_c0_g1_i1.p2  ORF type:complete len:151 (+),score=54.33 TRINITY_DN3322_c0_g1_i1:113-565(+)
MRAAAQIFQTMFPSLLKQSSSSSCSSSARGLNVLIQHHINHQRTTLNAISSSSSSSSSSSNTVMRNFSKSSVVQGTPMEDEVESMLKEHIENAQVEVNDISGGCGSMFQIQVVSPEFKGMNKVKQHRLVNDILKDYVKDWHGLTLTTKAD